MEDIPYFSSTKTCIFCKEERFHLLLPKIVEETKNIKETFNENTITNFQSKQHDILHYIEVTNVRDLIELRENPLSYRIIAPI